MSKELTPLEVAASSFADKNSDGIYDPDFDYLKAGFKAGAEWQAQQPIKDEGKEILIQALKDCKDCINWMWENLHLPHTSDHFNIPANTLEGIDLVLEKFQPLPEPPNKVGDKEL